MNLLNPKEKTKKICIDIVKAEIDELKKKKHQRWLWYALNHETGKILAYTFGKRKNSVFLKLKKLLKPFKIEICYSDNWISYKKHIEKNKHK